MDSLSEIWRDLAPESIQRGWVLDEQDVGPEQDDDDDVEWEN
jgi:hypothetical protein